MDETVYDTDQDEYYGLKESFDRLEPSEDTHDAFHEARQNGELQKQIDIIWSMLVEDDQITVGGES